MSFFVSRQACTLHQKISGTTPAAPHAMSELVPSTLAHLNQEAEKFFAEWIRKCGLETEESSRKNTLKNLWTQTPEQREQSSAAIARMRLATPRVPTGNEKNHVLVKPSAIKSGVFKPSDSVIVSTDRELAVASGVIVKLNRLEMHLVLDRDLYHKNQDLKRFYHVDHYQYSGGLSGSLVSLARLLSNTPESERLRTLILDQKEVSFLKGLPKEVATVGKHILRPLNRVQQKAIFRTLMAEQYVLLKGMPGTGKTTMIVALVRLLVALGKSVLLTSYTHSAVDNILLKLKDDPKTKFLRLGRSSRIHPDLKEFSADIQSENAGSISELRSVYTDCPVIATTCLSLNHPSVRQRTFDYCILDEAGQSMLLSAIGPLFHGAKFVLVGDPLQLPPVVQSEEARKLGMDVSLFSHLEQPNNVIPLNIQYRMNKILMDFANHLTYQGQLEAGSEEVANRTISLLPTTADHLDSEPTFMRQVLSPKLKDSMVFLDTSLVDAFDESGSNSQEAELVCRLHSKFRKFCTPDTSLGVIAPYRNQVKLLQSRLDSGEDINTVDQFQGKDKDVILYSCTRSRGAENEDDFKISELDILGDLRRLNVAMTRAKSKLVMVGNKRTLTRYENTFKKLFDFMTSEQIVVLNKEDMASFSS